MTDKVLVAYDHDPADLAPIYLAVTSGEPGDSDWRGAFRDTVGGRLVVWVAGSVPPGHDVWLRDRTGIRQVG